jgi:hypothetical protein
LELCLITLSEQVQIIAMFSGIPSKYKMLSGWDSVDK